MTSTRSQPTTPTARGHRADSRRKRLSASALVLAAALLSGCTFTNPQMTTQPYLPSDGQVASLDPEVDVAALKVITEGAGEPGALVARLVNASERPREVRVSAEGLDEAFTVPARSTLAIGGVFAGSTPVVLPAVPSAPGLLMPMTLHVDGAETIELRVPVLDGALEAYRPYLAVAAGTAQAL